ncbi:MAG TPA: universal stress protein [Marmoricola sp.]|nr:universal stress protein [Marmoricola sp.]
MSSTDNRPGSIVVGLDGTAGARAALRFALEAGVARGLPVDVVTTWVAEMPARDRITPEMIVTEAGGVRREQDRILAEVVRDLPAAPVISQVVLHDVGGEPLVKAAKDAAMLVVGSGRARVLDEMPLGAVSEYCVRHSRVPVVVVPDPSRAVDRPAPPPTA